MSRNSGDVLYHLIGTQQIYSGRTLLDIDSLEIYRAEILALVGPIGAGKSTFKDLRDSK